MHREIHIRLEELTCVDVKRLLEHGSTLTCQKIYGKIQECSLTTLDSPVK